MKKKLQAAKLDGEAAKCEVCATRDATVLCDEDNVRLCSICDMTVHSANKVAQRHTRWSLCSVCHRLKATKTSTTPQEQGIDVCTSCAGTVPKGRLHKVAGALAAPALHVPQEQAQAACAAPFDSSECLTDMQVSNGASSGQQVWVRDATLVLGSGIGPPGGRHQAAPAEAIMQQVAPNDVQLGRTCQGVQGPLSALGGSCGAGMDHMNVAAEGMQLRSAGMGGGGGGGTDTPDVLDALFNSWGEEGGPSFEEPEVDATAAAARDLGLSIWADSPTDMATGGPSLPPDQAPHEPLPYTAGGSDSGVLGLDTVAAAGAVRSALQSSTAAERAEHHAASPLMQAQVQQQQQQRQKQAQEDSQERALHVGCMQEGQAPSQPAAQHSMDIARSSEPVALGHLEGNSSLPFDSQRQQRQDHQEQAVRQSKQCGGQEQQEVSGGILLGQRQQQQQQQQNDALAGIEVTERRPYVGQGLQRTSPASPRQRSSGSQAMDYSQPPAQQQRQQQQQGWETATRDSDSSMGQRQTQSAAGFQTLKVDMAAASQGAGALMRPALSADVAPAAAGATVMPWLGSILGTQYQGLAPEQQLGVNNFLIKQDPAALQSSGVMGGIGAAGGVVLPATGLLAPSPRQSCDGTSVLTPFSQQPQQPQQPFNVPALSTGMNTMAGGYAQPFSSCVNFLPGIRADKGSTNPLYEAALLSAASMMNPWRPGLQQGGVPVSSGGLQLPAGLLAAAAAAGPLPLPLPLLGPIQTLASAAWAQAAAAQSSGPHAGGAASGIQPLAPPPPPQQQQQLPQQLSQAGDMTVGASQHFASGGGANPAASGLGYSGPATFGATAQQQQQHGQAAPAMQPQPQTSGLSATQHQAPPAKQEPSTSSAQGANSYHCPAAPGYSAQCAQLQLPNRVSSNGGRALAPPAPGPGHLPGGMCQQAPHAPHSDYTANASSSNAAAAQAVSQPQARPLPPQQQQQQSFPQPGSHHVRPQQLSHQLAPSQQSNGQQQGLAPSLSQTQHQQTQQPQQQVHMAGAGYSLPFQGFQQQSAQQLYRQQQTQQQSQSQQQQQPSSQQQQQMPAAQPRGSGLGLLVNNANVSALLGGSTNPSALLLFNQQQNQQLQQLQQLLLQSAGQGPKNQQQLLMQLAQQLQPQQQQQQQQHVLPPTAGLGAGGSSDAFGGLLMSPMAQWLMMNMSHASSTANVQQATPMANTGGSASMLLGLQLPPGAAGAFSAANPTAAAAAAAAAGLTSVPATSVLAAGSHGGGVPAVTATVATAATSAVMPVPAPEGSKVSRERDPRDREARDHAERDEALTRYRQKRKTRHFEKTIRYASRQILSHKRPRIKGRFVKTQPCQAAIIGMSPLTAHEPRTSEDPEAGDDADDEQEAELELEEVEEENDPLGPGQGHGPGHGHGPGGGTSGGGCGASGPKPQHAEVDGGLPMMDLDGPGAVEGPQEAMAEGGLGPGLGMDICGMLEGREDGPARCCRNSCDAMEVEVSGGGGCGGGGAGGGGGGCASGDVMGLGCTTAAAVAVGRGASVGGSNEKASFQHLSAGVAGAGLAAVGYGGAASAAVAGANGVGYPQHHHPYHHHYTAGRHHNHHHASGGCHLGNHAGLLPLGMLAVGAVERPSVATAAAATAGVDAGGPLGGGEALRMLAKMDVQQLSGQTPAHAQAALSGSAHAQAQRGISGGTHGGGAEEEEEAVGPSHSVNSRLSAGSVHTPGRWRALGGASGAAAGGAYEEVGQRGGAHSHPYPYSHPPAHGHPHPYQLDGATYWASTGPGNGLGGSGINGRQAVNGGGAAARANGASGAAEADATVSTNGAAKNGGAVSGKANAKASRNGNGNGTGGSGGNGSGGLHAASKMTTAAVTLTAAVPCSAPPVSALLPIALPMPLPSPAEVLLTSRVKSLTDVCTADRQRQVQEQQQPQHAQRPQYTMLAPGAVSPARAIAAAAAAAAAGGCSGGAGGPGGCGGGAIGARHSPKRQQTAAFDMPPCLPMPSTASCGGLSPLGAVGAGAGGPVAGGCRRGTPAPCCLVPDCATDAAAPCCMSGGGTTEQGSCMEDNHTLVDAETAGGGAGDGEGDSECCSAEPLVSGASNTVPSVEASTHGQQGQQRIRCRRSSPQLSVRM